MNTVMTKKMSATIINYGVLYWKPTALSLTGLLLICLTKSLVALPINGIYLLTYISFVIIITTWVSFITLQNFLNQNKPLDLSHFLKPTPQSAQKEDLSTTNSRSVKNLALDIDEYFIRKWFVYISSDRTFNEESLVILEEILRKMVNVQLSLDNEVVIQGVLNLYLKHLKEFRRSLRRREKYSGKISELYRYSHVCSNSKKTKHYYIHQLTTTLLNHFINWELSNSLPYRVLVSIISKRVTLYLLNLFSNPEFFNFYLLKSCASAEKQKEINLAKFGRVKIVQVTDNTDLTPNLSKASSYSSLNKFDAKAGPVFDFVQTQAPENTDVEPTLALKSASPPSPFEQINEEVKIYEPKSCKTWYDSMDLDSVTLGQDILDLLGDDKDETAIGEKEKEVVSPMTSAKNLLDEVKHMTEQMTSLEGIKTSMKPISDATMNNIKDLQENVNNVVKPMSQATSTALHKIGGLHLQDEAAGVVEGILDFGRTRIRKGLRLTGLQENTELLSKQAPKKNIIKMPHVSSQEKTEEVETSWVNPLQDDLTIMHKSDPIDIKTVRKVPSILTHEDSPEPEYEETADLATSIAKLRSLLEQKSSGSNVSTPTLSPMPPDDLTQKLLGGDEADETDGVMPSFYKFCAKTATGVISNTLNTIKTALPGNVPGCDRLDGMENWYFIEANSSDCDLFIRMHKLLCERKVFCTVDTAFEAIDSLGSLQQADKLRQPNIQFEDELDDFEVKLPITKTLLDVMCELLADNKETSLAQEPVIRSILLALGNHIEAIVKTKAASFVRYWCSNAKIPAESNIAVLELELEEFVDIILSGVPDYVKYLVGEKCLKDATNLFVSSLQVQRINQDMLMQVFEIICMKLMDGSKELSPISA